MAKTKPTGKTSTYASGTSVASARPGQESDPPSHQLRPTSYKAYEHVTASLNAANTQPLQPSQVQVLHGNGSSNAIALARPTTFTGYTGSPARLAQQAFAAAAVTSSRAKRAASTSVSPIKAPSIACSSVTYKASSVTIGNTSFAQLPKSATPTHAYKSYELEPALKQYIAAGNHLPYGLQPFRLCKVSEPPYDHQAVTGVYSFHTLAANPPFVGPPTLWFAGINFGVDTLTEAKQIAFDLFPPATQHLIDRDRIFVPRISRAGQPGDCFQVVFKNTVDGRSCAVQYLSGKAVLIATVAGESTAATTKTGALLVYTHPGDSILHKDQAAGARVLVSGFPKNIPMCRTSVNHMLLVCAQTLFKQLIRVEAGDDTDWYFDLLASLQFMPGKTYMYGDHAIITLADTRYRSILCEATGLEFSHPQYGLVSLTFAPAPPFITSKYTYPILAPHITVCKVVAEIRKCNFMSLWGMAHADLTTIEHSMLTSKLASLGLHFGASKFIMDKNNHCGLLMDCSSEDYARVFALEDSVIRCPLSGMPYDITALPMGDLPSSFDADGTDEESMDDAASGVTTMA